MSPSTLTHAEKKRFEVIQPVLLQWYKKNRRSFSWRKKIRHPYEVLLCEVMGQQTQASRIEQFLPKFIERFPTLVTLASAKQSDVIKQWQGLGYNRRALNLYRAAKILTKNYPGSFPKTEEELLTLPGIGIYTARAILIFAFNKPIATVDVNIQRVLSRLFKKMPDANSVLPVNDIIAFSAAILPAKNSRLWHEALMDFGASICTKRNPECGECPLSANCKSRNLSKLEIKPKIQQKKKKYFGHPKRIWRGKILKIISSNNKTDEQYVIANLQSSFPYTEFSLFIRNVLDDLVRESFCDKKNKTYQLHQ
jgi:A/G-specific adenine glycosylase